jgi:hypothetical protein
MLETAAAGDTLEGCAAAGKGWIRRCSALYAIAEVEEEYLGAKGWREALRPRMASACRPLRARRERFEAIGYVCGGW